VSKPALYYQIEMSARGIVFDHIAIGVPRIADAPAVLVGALGGRPEAAKPSRGFNWGCWRFAGGGRLEILEPSGDDGFLHRFLTQRGPGVHHVTFKVPSLRDACQRAEAHGYAIVGRDESQPGWKEAFLHPRQALGVVVQFAEASGRDTPRFRLPLPPGPPDPPPPATVLGLRLRARSRERARTQWETVLQGESTEAEDGAVIYRWPGSPMRIAVEIDPGAAEGPIGIDVASERPIGLAGRPLGVAWLVRSVDLEKGASR
jgi:catechol 2,3-dioxygenase-like lactoylglutathione lyase family enzyme